MKKSLTTLQPLLALAVGGLFLLTFGPGARAQAQSDASRIDALEKELKALKQTISELSATNRPAAARPAEEAPPAAQPSPAPKLDPNDPIMRIRDEGLNHSQVMTNLSYLCDVLGPRLTGSPELKRANEWTRDLMTSWGLVNGQLEPWGPFGRGWTLKRYYAEVIEPYTFPVIGSPKAWSPGLKKPIVANVVYLDARTEADLEKYKGKLKNAIVLISPPVPVREHFEPIATRYAESNLLRMANTTSPGGRGNVQVLEGPGGTPGGRRGGAGTNAPALAGGGRRGGAGTNAPAFAGPGRRGGAGFGAGSLQGRILAFLLKEGAALALSPSTSGDYGTIFVSQAALPATDTAGGRGTAPGTNAPGQRANAGRRGAPAPAGGGRGPSYYGTNAPPTPPQVMVAVEDYDRLVRMIQDGAKVKMAVDFETAFQTKDTMAYNTIAEIPGTDLKDEIVMVGGHIDSWQGGTGATDNGAGVAVSMEAVRILQALKLQPRRTIRVGLWSGEEQGLMGSRAYVTKHFGYYTNTTGAAAGGRGGTGGGGFGGGGGTLVRGPEYEKLSAYFNYDNGGGKIRGIYLQGNEAARALFTKWLEPFHDLGAKTVTIQNTSGTDHLSFDNIGLPGFQFIQDSLDYGTRTHHSNEDVYDRIQADDLKQSATIMAAFIYNAAMMDEKVPRKPMN